MKAYAHSRFKKKEKKLRDERDEKVKFYQRLSVEKRKMYLNLKGH